MSERGSRRSPSKQFVAALLGYVLALHLIIAGLAGATRAAQEFSPQALLDPHALCLGGFLGDSPDGDRSDPANTDHHDLCCTLACGSIALLTPAAFATTVYAATADRVVHATYDFGARPSTAPPGLAAKIHRGAARPAQVAQFVGW